MLFILSNWASLFLMTEALHPAFKVQHVKTCRQKILHDCRFHTSPPCSFFAPAGGTDRQQCVWLRPPRRPCGDGRAAGHEASPGARPSLAGYGRGWSQLSILIFPVRDPWARWELQLQWVGWRAGPLPNDWAQVAGVKRL